MQKRPEFGPDALNIDITPMPNGQYLMVETNVVLADDPALLAALDAIDGIDPADADVAATVPDPFSIALKLERDNLDVRAVARQIEQVLRQFCQQ